MSNLQRAHAPKGIVGLFSNAVETERRYPWILTPLLFFILGVFGMMWIPFYPLWMVLLVALLVAVISIKFPYLSLVLLSGFVSAAASYQTPEFGLFTLIFMLATLIVSLFEWKLGYLGLLMIFLSRFGLSMVVPVVAATMMPLLLSVAVLVLGGVFLTFLVTCGNLTVAGMLVGPVHQSSFMAFFDPTVQNFTLTEMGTAILGIQEADLDIISSVVGDNLGLSVGPIVQIFIIGIAVFIVHRLFHREVADSKWTIPLAFIPPAIITGTFVGFYMYELNPGQYGYIAAALLFGALFSSILLGRAAREFFQPYFQSIEREASVGTRISDMENLGTSSFELVGGLEDVKEDLKESIMVPLLMGDIAAKYGIDPPKGVLLFGPPGCGKTMLMKALANELNVEMVTVKCSDIMSKWYGESETKVADLFRMAKERRPCIIFFDDLEAMAKHRDLYAGDDVTPRLLSIILAELDGMDHSAGIILVGTTNKPEMVDPALLRPGRFDKIIYVPPPDFEERKSILNVHLEGRPLSPGIVLDEVAVKCERFSGADLANLAREAATVAMKRAIDTGEDAQITSEDLNYVASVIKPSISLAMLKTYELLKLDFERKMHKVKRDSGRRIVSWDDVAGADRLKKDLHDYMQLLIKEPKVLEDFKLKTGRGMLLFGPPGCGKKHIMKAAANNLDITIQDISATELIGGQTQFTPSIKEIFYRAREAAPSIVLIEHIDVIGAKDVIEDPEAGKVMGQILAEVDDVDAREHILVIATTNCPHLLHSSLLRPGRFDKLFYVPPPNLEAREKIFGIYLKNIPVAPDVTKATLKELANRSEHYSSADIAAVVDEAKLMAVINAKDASKRAVSRDDLLNALERVESSISPEDLDSSMNFMKVYKARKT
ncbi:MAG: AAA family ATPase [Thermoplasmata archaeon]|nr:AAA family ATPase [Thermoplasmata archaeon]